MNLDRHANRQVDRQTDKEVILVRNLSNSFKDDHNNHSASPHHSFTLVLKVTGIDSLNEQFLRDRLSILVTARFHISLAGVCWGFIVDNDDDDDLEQEEENKEEDEGEEGEEEKEKEKEEGAGEGAGEEEEHLEQEEENKEEDEGEEEKRKKK